MTLGLVPFVAHCLAKLACWRTIWLSSCHRTSRGSFWICFFIFSTSSRKRCRSHYLNHYNWICRSVTAEYFWPLWAHLWLNLHVMQVQSWSLPLSRGVTWVSDLDLLSRWVLKSQIQHQHLLMKATFSLWPIPSLKLLFKRCQASNLILHFGPKLNLSGGGENRLIPLGDKFFPSQRLIIETINGQLKNICDIERSRRRSPVNFMVNLIAELISDTWKVKKPSIKTPQNTLIALWEVKKPNWGYLLSFGLSRAI